MKILLVDDEPLARKRMRSILGEIQNPTHSIVGECGDVISARESIAQLKPDLLLLDIHMAGETGLDLTRSIKPGQIPLVILVTAHADHALEAFEAHALDYLLKPVRPARLQEALFRAHRLLQLLQTHTRPDEIPRRLSVKSDGKIEVLQFQDIQWIEAAGNYMILHTTSGNHIHRETLTSLERLLPSTEFLRLNRSVIARIEAIQSIERTGRGDYEVVLKDGTRVSTTCGLKELEDKIRPPKTS